ncbi:MAG TPA: HEAT repeat domain-containing protein, partial [Ktedonobacterales bacterium]|nr:HEAT repeat domain-containing protein [Ktedonobacterales bacterium]
MGTDRPTTPGDGYAPDDDAIARLLHVLATDDYGPAGYARAYAAAQALAQRGAPGIAALAEVLRTWGEYGPMAPMACIEALGNSGDPRAAAPLRDVLRLPPADGLFGEALRASNALARLGKAGSAALADVVATPGLPSDSSLSAAPALASSGDTEVALAPLLAALSRHREDPLAAMAAAKGLGTLRSPEAVPALIAVLGERPPVGNNAQNALYHIGEAAIPALLQAVFDPQDGADQPEAIRRAAAWTLSGLAEHPAALDGLVPALDDADPEVCAAAICAQSAHGGLEALPTLERIHQQAKDVSPDDRLAYLAYEAIRAIREREREAEADKEESLAVEDDNAPSHEAPEGSDELPTDDLARLREIVLADWEDVTKFDRAEEAAHALARLGKAGLEVLVSIACDSSRDGHVRAAALDGLGGSGNVATALVPLLAVLHDRRDAWLAQRAAAALGALGTPDAIPDLIEALTDQDLYFQGGPVTGLVRIGKPAIAPVAEALTAGPQSQHQSAARVLRELSADPEAAQALVAALADPDPQVREQAI